MANKQKDPVSDSLQMSTISLSTLYLYNLPNAPDGGYGWVIVFAAFCNNMIADGLTFSFGIMFNELIEQFNESHFITSLFSSMFNGIPLMCAPFTSLLIERFSCRNIAVIGAYITHLGYFLSFFTNSFMKLFFTLGILAPAGLSFLYITSIVMVSKYFDKKRAFATGIAVSGSGVGAMVFSPLLAFLIEKYTYRGAMLILSAIILHGCAFGMLHIPLENYNIDKRKASIFQDAYERFVNRVDCMYTKAETMSEISEFTSAEDGAEDGGAVFANTNTQKIETAKKNENEHKNGNNTFLDIELSRSFLANIPIKVSDRSDSTKTGKVSKSVSEPSSSNHYARQSIHLTGIKPYIPQDPRAIYGRRTVGKHVQLAMETVRDFKNKKKTPYHYVVARSRFQAKYTICLLITKKNKRVNIFKTFQLFFSGFFDFNLLIKWKFLLLVFSNFLLYMCYPIAYNNLPSYAKENNIGHVSLFPLLIGLGNIVGQISIGYLADFDRIQSISLYITFNGFAGISCILLTFYRTHVVSFLLFSIVFGLTISANFSLCSVILVDIFGLELLTNTYGLVLFGQGIGSAAGPLIIGYIRDQQENYDTSFLFAGAVIVCSSVIIIPVMVATNKYLGKVLSQTTRFRILLDIG